MTTRVRLTRSAVTATHRSPSTGSSAGPTRCATVGSGSGSHPRCDRVRRPWARAVGAGPRVRRIRRSRRRRRRDRDRDSPWSVSRVTCNPPACGRLVDHHRSQVDRPPAPPTAHPTSQPPPYPRRLRQTQRRAAVNGAAAYRTLEVCGRQIDILRSMCLQQIAPGARLEAMSGTRTPRCHTPRLG